METAILNKDMNGNKKQRRWAGTTQIKKCQAGMLFWSIIQLQVYRAVLPYYE